jgi:protein-tyrosine phosphatase
VIDLHCHVLPGIDDGPATIAGSLALARAAAAAGTSVLVATPHISWRYRNDAQTITQLVAEVNRSLAVEQVTTPDGAALEIRPGAEIALTQIIDIEPAELAQLGLGGGEWLLVEPPFTPVATGLDTILLDFIDRGHRIVLAHPERCPAFQHRPDMLAMLVDAGVLTSITAGSLVGQFGGEARRCALELAQAGLLHNVASDAHDDVHRPPGIAAKLELTGFAPLANWLTRAVPSAILDGGEIPPRPAVDLAEMKPARQHRWLPRRH